MTRALLLVAAATLVACTDSEGPNLKGMYQVTHVVADQDDGDVDAGCEMDIDVDPTGYAPYLLFHTESLLGTAYYAYDGCPDATGVGCTTIGGLVGGFYQPTADGWAGFTSFSSGDDTSCTLGYDAKTATLDHESPAGLVIEHHLYRDEHVMNAPCTTDEAERRAELMPCVAHDRTEAIRL